MRVVVLRLKPGQDLKRTLLDYCEQHELGAVCILTCVGSLQRAVLRYAGASEGVILEQPMEIVSLAGTLSRYGGHLHIALSDATGQVVGGHLMEGSAIHTTAEVALGLLQGITFKREFDSATGYNELVLEYETEAPEKAQE